MADRYKGKADAFNQGVQADIDTDPGSYGDEAWIDVIVFEYRAISNRVTRYSADGTNKPVEHVDYIWEVNTNLRARIADPRYLGRLLGTLTDGATPTAFGSTDTQVDVTDEGGNTFRFTWDGTGTDPNWKTNGLIPGINIVVKAGGAFAAGNEGTFPVTASTDTYFEVTNAAGSAEANVVLTDADAIVVAANYFSAVIPNAKAYHGYKVQYNSTELGKIIGQKTDGFDFNLRAVDQPLEIEAAGIAKDFTLVAAVVTPAARTKTTLEGYHSFIKWNGSTIGKVASMTISMRVRLEGARDLEEMGTDEEQMISEICEEKPEFTFSMELLVDESTTIPEDFLGSRTIKGTSRTPRDLVVDIDDGAGRDFVITLHDALVDNPVDSKIEEQSGDRIMPITGAALDLDSAGTYQS